MCKVRVLVVDDCRDTADCLARLFGKTGCDVEVAYDGAGALAVAVTFRPHVAFLDVAMPGRTGLWVAEHVRATPDLAHMMLVALSGYADEKNRALARSAGFDHFLPKPTPFAELLEIVEPLCDVTEAQR